MTACRYFDGVSSRARPATVDIDGTGVRVVGDDVDRRVAREAMRFVPAVDYGPARIAFIDGGLCEFDDRVAAGELFAALGHRLAATDRLVSRTWQVVTVTVGFVLVMAVLYRWGVPWMSDRIVDRVPARWEATLGVRILATLDARHFFEPSELQRPVRDRIAQRFEVVRRTSGDAQASLVFRRMAVPNALALPGGIVVVTDEIVRIAGGDDDALATVLAHELGHVVHRDALRQLARSTITSALAAWYFGDVSNVAAIAAGSLGTFRYSREAEHEADLYAVRAMHATGTSTVGAARLFRRLQAWTPGVETPSHPDPQGAAPPRADTRDDRAAAGQKSPKPALHLPEYLSTHPDTDDRIRLFESDGAADAGRRAGRDDAIAPN